MNDLTPLKASLPLAAIDTINKIDGRIFDNPKQAIAELESAMASVEQLCRWLPSASRTATLDEVRKCIAVLVGCFPSGNREAVYVTALIHDVMDDRPSLYALDRACRHLRRTSKFMPAICEVLEAISEQEDKLAELKHRAAKVPERLAYFKSIEERKALPPPTPTEEELSQQRREWLERQKQKARHLEATKNYKPSWYALHSEEAQKIRYSLDKDFTDDEWIDYWHANSRKLKARWKGVALGVAPGSARRRHS